MSEDFKVFSNIRTLRAQARETSLETLEEILEKMTSIVEEKRHEEETGIKERDERKVKIEAIREQLLADGIDPQELLSNYRSSSASKNKNQAVILDLQNINIPMRMAMRKAGRGRGAHLKQ